jgi:hypothetical protein
MSAEEKNRLKAGRRIEARMEVCCSTCLTQTELTDDDALAN